MSRGAEGTGEQAAGAGGQPPAGAALRLRAARASDAPAWALLSQAESLAVAKRTLADAQRAPHTWLRVLVAAMRDVACPPSADTEADEALLACVHAQVVVPECELVDVWVHPGQRRRGLGHAALSALFAELRAAGVASVHLEVARHNRAARALYRRMGFVQLGARRGYYSMATRRARDGSPCELPRMMDVGESLDDALTLMLSL